jgi:uncharacterized membrane-anchored protein YhcB (DUF1043 family)
MGPGTVLRIQRIYKHLSESSTVLFDAMLNVKDAATHEMIENYVNSRDRALKEMPSAWVDAVLSQSYELVSPIRRK